MGIYDQENLFSANQAITASAISSNVIDLVATSNLTRDIGAGENVWVVVTVTTTLDSAAEGASMAVNLESDDNVGLTTPTVHYTAPAVAESVLNAGYQIKFRVPPGSYERYVGLRYTVSGENMTSGNVTAGLVRDAEFLRNYASGFDSSVT